MKPEDIPESTAAKLTRPIEEARRLGFALPVYQVCQTLTGESVTTAVNCRHAGGEIIARILHIRLGTIHPPKELVTSSLISQLADGRRLVTSARRAAFDPPPNVIVQRLVDGSLEALLALHQQKLDELRSSVTPEKLPDDAAMAALCDRSERESLEFNLSRGLYEELGPEEVSAQSIKAAARRSLPGADEMDAAVLADIEKLQSKRGNWTGAVLVALLSFVAFVTIGRVRWDWPFVFILTGVVAFHETGHYFAMRVFRYKDVRMFFVPLLGAAVTGRHYNVKGWQRAIVSLSGPVPGILIGLVLTGIALTTHNRLLERTALIALLVNGINLLPFVPLDGGWVAHALIFSRHYVLETAFMGLAGFALIAATALGHGRLWICLGILVLIALPISYRLARLASRLRAKGIPTASADDQSIPPETAMAIIHELKQDPHSMQLTRHLASQTLDVFQRLNATPPGISASVLLLAVYMGAAALSFVGTAAIFASRSGRLTAQIEQLLPQPTRIVDPAALRVSGLTNETKFDWLVPVVIGTFTNTIEAESAFQLAAKQAEATDRLTLFGQSIFLSGANASSNWPAWFKQRGAEVSVERPASNLTSIVTLSCRAPDEATATAVQRDCEPYFKGLWLKIWPPWASLDGLEPASVERIERNRYTWTRLQDIDQACLRDPEYKRSVKSRRFSLRRRTAADWIENAKKQLDLQQSIYRRELDKLAFSGDSRLDKELVRLYDRYWFATGTNRDEAMKTIQHSLAIGPGGLSPNENLPTNGQGWRAVLTGDLVRSQSNLDFRFLVFYRTDFGLPSLVAYLQQKGCDHFHYDIRRIADEDEKPPQGRDE